MAKGKKDAKKKDGRDEAGKPAAKQAKDKKPQAPAAKSGGRRKAPAKPGEKEQSLFQKIRQFFREVKVELKKVTWPSRKETIASTSVVLVVVVIVAAYLGVVDVILSRTLKLLLH